MLILNINGPINSGKTTVSKILVNLLPNATFIEVDELMNDEEEKRLGLSIQDGWAKRQKRLNEKLLELKASREFETVIFAYPISEKSYKTWSSLADKNTRFINITLAPSLEECLKNRGTRELDDWERNRIKEMYEEGYQNRPYSDFVINNDNQTPKETAEIIKDFIEHALSPEQQWLHLVERRWPALMSGEKISTFRLNEGFIHKGFLVYKDCPKEQWAEVVYVTHVYYVPLKQAIEIDGFDAHTPDMETALMQMKVHYPDITYDTPILLAQHLSVPETKKRFPDEVKKILEKMK
ncbi:MAG: shikimate kinase [Pseudomonadota bacterium]|nr:shikimate kinase [Pseudomonadota bacterium]